MMCTCAMSRQPAPSTAWGPTTQKGPIATSSPITAPDATRAVASSTGIAPSCSLDHGADPGFGDPLAGDLGLAAEPPHGLALGHLLHMVFDRIARHDGLAEFRLVDGEEIDDLGPSPGRQRHDADGARGLRHALDQEDARKHRIAREMSEELRLVGGDVLDADGGFIAADLDDLVHHQERIAMGKRAEQLLDIGRADGLPGHLSSPVSSRPARPRPRTRTRRPTIASAFSHSRNGRAGNPPHFTPAGTAAFPPLAPPRSAPVPSRGREA